MIGSPSLVLDHVDQVVFDPLNTLTWNPHGLLAHRAGLHRLAVEMRRLEQENIDNDPHPAAISLFETAAALDPVIYCTFSWFATSLVAYLRNVSLIAMTSKNRWSIYDLSTERKSIKEAADNYVHSVIPEVALWRNKVGAHSAASDPYKDENPATILHSLNYPIYCIRGVFYTAAGTLAVVAGTVRHESELRKWSVTDTFTRLSARLWPDAGLDDLRR